jgi:mRNA interferase RelE/StbE
VPLALSRSRIIAALTQMEADPFSGELVRLAGQQTGYRRRVGNWRIMFDADPVTRTVSVRAIERRTTTTYRKRKVNHYGPPPRESIEGRTLALFSKDFS